MLKRVIFALNKSLNPDDPIRRSFQRTADYIAESGYESELLDISSAFFTNATEDEKHGTLILTDREAISKALTESGFYVVGILHEQNAGEKFTGLKYVFSELEEVDMDSFVKAYQRYAGEPWEVIRTDRLLIRETTLEDVDIFYKIYADPEITRYMEGLFENPEDEKRYQKDYINKVYGLMGFGLWTLVRSSDNTVIGRAGYSVRNGFDEIELGFLIGKEYQRQGYAFEACSAILDYGRDVLMFDKVQTLVKKENTVSIHMCERLGFEELDEVDVEENIYGKDYGETQMVNLDSGNYGKYVRFIKYLNI